MLIGDYSVWFRSHLLHKIFLPSLPSFTAPKVSTVTKGEVLGLGKECWWRVRGKDGKFRDNKTTPLHRDNKKREGIGGGGELEETQGGVLLSFKDRLRNWDQHDPEGREMGGRGRDIYS